MDKFDRFSLFPVYIDIPLKYAASKAIKERRNEEQVDHLLKSTLRLSESPDFYIEEPNKLTILLQSEPQFHRGLNAFKLNDQTILLGKNGDGSFIADTSSFSDIDSVEIIQEGDMKLEPDDLQAIISKVLDLLHK